MTIGLTALVDAATSLSVVPWASNCVRPPTACVAWPSMFGVYAIAAPDPGGHGPVGASG